MSKDLSYQDLDKHINSYYEVSILYAVRNADPLHNIYLDLS